MKLNLKLNEDHFNEFITLHSGEAFYRKKNSLGKEENTIAISEDNKEAMQQLKYGVLVLDEEEKPVKEKVEKMIVEDNKIEKDTIKEVKTKTNNKKVEQFKGATVTQSEPEPEPKEEVVEEKEESKENKGDIEKDD